MIDLMAEAYRSFLLNLDLFLQNPTHYPWIHIMRSIAD